MPEQSTVERPIPSPVSLPSAHQSGNRLPHLPALDGLRGLAALMVVWFHYWAWVPSGVGPSSIRRTAIFGQTGVDLFFVLSGFLITRNLLAAIGTKAYFRTFYWRRALRIFPLYFGTLAAVYWLAPAIGLTQPIAGQLQAWYWLYGQNIATTFGFASAGPVHFWSLAIEEHFYLVWPFVVYRCGRARLGTAIGVTIGLALLSRVGLAAFGYDGGRFSLSLVDVLAMGALLALVENRRWDRDARQRLATGGLLAAGCVALLWTRTGGSHATWLQVVKPVMIGVVYLCAVGWCALGKPARWTVRLLGDGPLAFTGGISYGLYVVHPFVLDGMTRWTDEQSARSHPYLVGLGFLVVSLALAWASYRWFERPFLSLKRYFVVSS